MQPPLPATRVRDGLFWYEHFLQRVHHLKIHFAVILHLGGIGVEVRVGFADKVFRGGAIGICQSFVHQSITSLVISDKNKVRIGIDNLANLVMRLLQLLMSLVAVNLAADPYRHEPEKILIGIAKLSSIRQWAVKADGAVERAVDDYFGSHERFHTRGEVTGMVAPCRGGDMLVTKRLICLDNIAAIGNT